MSKDDNNDPLAGFRAMVADQTRWGRQEHPPRARVEVTETMVTVQIETGDLDGDYGWLKPGKGYLVCAILSEPGAGEGSGWYRYCAIDTPLFDKRQKNGKAANDAADGGSA